MKTRIFKTKGFYYWAIKEGLSDGALRSAVSEMEAGLLDANLGSFVYKKRVALPGRGKRGGARTLVAFKREDKAFFIYGFAKNQQANVMQNELKALKLLATQLLNYTDEALTIAMNKNELLEVSNDE
jgi:hypothetical protein